MLPLVIAPWQIAMPIFILIILVLALVINSTIRRRKKAIRTMKKTKR